MLFSGIDQHRHVSSFVVGVFESTVLIMRSHASCRRVGSTRSRTSDISFLPDCRYPQSVLTCTSNRSGVCVDHRIRILFRSSNRASTDHCPSLTRWSLMGDSSIPSCRLRGQKMGCLRPIIGGRSHIHRRSSPLLMPSCSSFNVAAHLMSGRRPGQA